MQIEYYYNRHRSGVQYYQRLSVHAWNSVQTDLSYLVRQ